MAGQARVLGATLLGIEGVPVEVEVRISSQLPRVDIVGLPEAAVRESAARVRAAIQAVDLPFPDRRITINLAPASLRKQGAGLDLAIAVCILAAGGQLPLEGLGRVGLVGELALDGRLRGVRGALALATSLRREGCSRVVVPEANGAEGALLGVDAPECAGHLGEVIRSLNGESALPQARSPEGIVRVPQAGDDPDLAEVRGQAHAKRALIVAAAGGHGLLLRGAPGAGKSLLARCLPSLLPPLTREESLEVARSHYAAGFCCASTVDQGRRPFRAPHHSASRAGLLGGGRQLAPGEVSLAHHGVLFLDELPEFDRSALEALRQVLEDGRVVHARADQRVTFPARIQLLAAANPCVCGYWGSGVRDCRCDDGALARYERRLSGPLLDRIDLHVQVRPVPFAELDRAPASRESALPREARAPGRCGWCR